MAKKYECCENCQYRLVDINRYPCHRCDEKDFMFSQIVEDVENKIQEED